MRCRLERVTALVLAVVCALMGSVPWLIRRDMRGALIERQLDTNGDGRTDVVEYYRDGALLRRDSDRNFNGVTDLVEDFDAVTQERVRSIEDQDYDGTADVLQLYRNGQPIVSERAVAPNAADLRQESGPTSTRLVSLRNPFAGHRAFDSPAGPAPIETWMGPSPNAGVIASAADLPGLAPSLARLARPCHADFAPERSLRSPRGPPLA